MNFKTTVILLVLLAVVALVLLLTRQTEPGAEKPTEARLLDIAAGDITRISFTADDGQTTTFEKSDGKWRLTQPVQAAAEEFAVSSLVDAIAGLNTRGRVDPAGTGVDQPRYKLQITTKDNRTIKLDIGTRSGAGDNLYVRREGQTHADVVPASLMDQLEKPLKDWRRERLFDVGGMQIAQIRIATTQQSLELQKRGANEWHVVSPTSMPAETTEASDIASAISGLRAEEFVTDQPPTSAELKRYGLDQPVMTVSFSTQPPATQPTTQPATQPTFTTIQFGRFGDVMKKNVYASTSAEPGVVLVPATSLDSFRKTPLDLRDRRVLSIEEDRVSKIAITIDKAATTQPTTRAAQQKTIVLERARTTIASTQPTPTTQEATELASTNPATQQASTQQATTQPATTQPAEPPSRWKLASAGGADADDTKVADLLRELRPLRANKYVESSPPTTLPAATYTLAIETPDATHEIRLVDPGDSKPLIGMYGGLTFEVWRSLADRLDSEFAKAAAQGTTPAAPNGAAAGETGP
ncbi:DUF4340 domain-containing protein [Fontivita pretiosa]|uniref:DUF4340 domain-containing protein n=1 Tax=Fontivita pretiosa TaxID=2989684 RepID=UPI003D16D93A